MLWRRDEFKKFLLYTTHAIDGQYFSRLFLRRVVKVTCRSLLHTVGCIRIYVDIIGGVVIELLPDLLASKNKTNRKVNVATSQRNLPLKLEK